MSTKAANYQTSAAKEKAGQVIANATASYDFLF